MRSTFIRVKARAKVGPCFYIHKDMCYYTYDVKKKKKEKEKFYRKLEKVISRIPNKLF